VGAVLFPGRIRSLPVGWTRLFISQTQLFPPCCILDGNSAFRACFPAYLFRLVVSGSNSPLFCQARVSNDTPLSCGGLFTAFLLFFPLGDFFSPFCFPSLRQTRARTFPIPGQPHLLVSPRRRPCSNEVSVGPCWGPWCSHGLLSLPSSFLPSPPFLLDSTANDRSLIDPSWLRLLLVVPRSCRIG